MERMNRIYSDVNRSKQRKRRFSFFLNFPSVSSVIFCSIFLLLSALTGFAADTSAGFDSANKLYEQGKFSEAAAAYQQMIQSGTSSSALYFNPVNSVARSPLIAMPKKSRRVIRTCARTFNSFAVASKIQPVRPPTGNNGWPH
jgi:hypothetical protein